MGTDDFLIQLVKYCISTNLSIKYTTLSKSSSQLENYICVNIEPLVTKHAQIF